MSKAPAKKLTEEEKAAKHGALVVFGSGPGIGRNIAALFAEKGFSKIYLLSRNQERLQEDIDFVKNHAASASASASASSTPKVDGKADAETTTTSCKAIAVDLEDPGKVRAALAELDGRLHGKSLECVVFNAARVGGSKLMEWSAVNYEADLRVSFFFLLFLGQSLVVWRIVGREREGKYVESSTNNPRSPSSAC